VAEKWRLASRVSVLADPKEAAMSADGEELKCPACGARIYRSDVQCLNCGARLDEGRLAGSQAAVADAEMPPRTDERKASGVDYDIGAAAQRGWDPGQVAGGGGFFDSLSRGWVFLRESVLMAFRDKDLMLPSFFSILANLVLLGALALILHLTGNLRPLLSEGEQEIGPAGWVILIGMAFIGYVVTYFFTGMTVHLVDVHLKGKDAQLGSAFRDSLKNLGAILMLSVVTLVVSLLTSALRGRSRYGLRAAAANTADRAWTVASYLLLPIIILEDISFIDATSRGTRLHGRNLIQIVVGELGLMLTTRVVSFIIALIAIGIGVGFYLLSPTLLIVGIAIAALLLIAAMAFMAYVRTAFYTCLYLWAVAMETAGERVPAPAPLQPAIQRAW